MERFVAIVCGCVLACSACSSEWVPKGAEESTPSVVRTYPVHIPSAPDEAEAPAKAAHEVPKGKRAVTLDLSAARARHVKAGERVDVFVTYEMKGPKSDRGISGAGVVAFQDIEVVGNACDERACSLTLFMTIDEKEGLFALETSEDMDLHIWGRPKGDDGRLSGTRRTVREMIATFEPTSPNNGSNLTGVKGGETRRVALEVEHSPRALAQLRDGVSGEFTVTFKQTADEASAERAGASATVTTITLLQQVRIERARREEDRVVVELDVPVEHALLLTLARQDAERLDFSPQRPDEENAEFTRRTASEVLTEVDVVVVERLTRHPKFRRDKKGKKTIIVESDP